MPRPKVPHLSLPLRMTPAHSFAVDDQDSIEDVAQCVSVLLRTEEGSRIEVPEYGVPEFLFSQPEAVTIIEACERWEPRAEIDPDIVVGDSWDDLVTTVVANVRSVQ